MSKIYALASDVDEKEDKERQKITQMSLFQSRKTLLSKHPPRPRLDTIQDGIGEKRKTQFVFKNKEMLGRYICER